MTTNLPPSRTRPAVVPPFSPYYITGHRSFSAVRSTLVEAPLLDPRRTLVDESHYFGPRHKTGRDRAQLETRLLQQPRYRTVQVASPGQPGPQRRQPALPAPHPLLGRQA